MFKSQTLGWDKAGRRVVVGHWDKSEIVPQRHGKWAVFVERSNHQHGRLHTRFVLVNACTQLGTDEQTARALFARHLKLKR